MEKTNFNGNEIKRLLLEIIGELKDARSGLQTGTVLQKIEQRISIPHNDEETQQAVLTIWQDLFRSGYIAWGFNLGNPNPPFFHITEKGRRILRHLSRDPGNPDGYMQYIKSNTTLSPTVLSYLIEALDTYNYGSHKAAAVMIGCATERIILEIAETLNIKLSSLKKLENKDLNDWRIKRVLSGIESVLESGEGKMPTRLLESYQANWSAYTQLIRRIRNDAGHPTNIDEITEENVHASLLVFPELAKLASQLEEWIGNQFK
jgi:hypothetical protein